MTRNIIPLAGVFLACVIAAGIPAAAAADPAKPVAASTVEPTPLDTTPDDWSGITGPTGKQPVNQTPAGTLVQNTDTGNWWDSLWPFKNNTVTAPETTIVPQQAVTPVAPVVTTSPQETVTPADDTGKQDPAGKTASADTGAEKPRNLKNR